MQTVSTAVVTHPETAAALPSKQNFLILTNGTGGHVQELQKFSHFTLLFGHHRYFCIVIDSR